MQGRHEGRHKAWPYARRGDGRGVFRLDVGPQSAVFRKRQRRA